MAMGTPVPGCASLILLLVLTLGLQEQVEGCSCSASHPQQQFCDSEIVIRAKISGEKVVSPSNSSSPYLKMFQYEIKLIKMFKGFEKVKDIQYIYTSVFSSLCGIRLNTSNKIHYLLSGNMLSDGKVSIGLCDFNEPWDNLSMSQKKNLNHRYQMGCDCKNNECLWTDRLLDNSLTGDQARQFACIKRSDDSCSWYRGGPPPEKEFMDMSDP